MPQYWFPAKHYGWGWGFPIAWQGWLALVLFVGLVTTDVLIFPPTRALVPFFLSLAALCAALIAIAWLKGEPPRWRWGNE